MDDLEFEPTKDDTLNPAGLAISDLDYVQWRVQSNPRKDRLGIIWIMDVYRVVS